MIVTEAISLWMDRNNFKMRDELERVAIRSFLCHKYSHKSSINFNYEECIKKLENYLVEQQKRDPSTSGLVEKVYSFSNGFSIVRLLDIKSKQWEATHMRNCLGTHFYSVNENVYSLRDSKNVPHCTIEINPKENSVIRVRGKLNNPLSKKYSSYILEFIDSKHIQIDHQEFEFIGYTKLKNNQAKAIKNFFKNPVFIVREKNTYLWTGNILEKRKSFRSLSFKELFDEEEFKEQFELDTPLAQLFFNFKYGLYCFLKKIQNNLRSWNSIDELFPVIKSGQNAELFDLYTQDVRKVRKIMQYSSGINSLLLYQQDQKVLFSFLKKQMEIDSYSYYFSDFIKSLIRIQALRKDLKVFLDDNENKKVFKSRYKNSPFYSETLALIQFKKDNK